MTACLMLYPLQYHVSIFTIHRCNCNSETWTILVSNQRIIYLQLVWNSSLRAYLLITGRSVSLTMASSSVNPSISGISAATITISKFCGLSLTIFKASEAFPSAATAYQENFFTVKKVDLEENNKGMHVSRKKTYEKKLTFIVALFKQRDKTSQTIDIAINRQYLYSIWKHCFGLLKTPKRGTFLGSKQNFRKDYGGNTDGRVIIQEREWDGKGNSILNFGKGNIILNFLLKKVIIETFFC